jgi:glucan 1,3-beta-glucosidase
LQKFWDVQTQVNEKYGTGWLFWTWKNEEAAEWSYKRGMELGFISEKADEHKYKLEDVCK